MPEREKEGKEGKTEQINVLQGQSENPKGGEEKISNRLFGATETREELAQWRTLRQKNSNPLGVAKG